MDCSYVYVCHYQYACEQDGSLTLGRVGGGGNRGNYIGAGEGSQQLSSVSIRAVPFLGLSVNNEFLGAESLLRN